MPTKPKQWIIIRKAYRNGNQEPFRQAFIQLKKKILPYLGKKINTATREDLEDAYTDAVMAFAQRYLMTKSALPENVEAFIRAAAYRKLIDSWRKKNKTSRIKVETMDNTKMRQMIKVMFSTPISYEEDFQEQENTQQQRLFLLQKAIYRLCDKCRTLIEEHLFESKTLRQLKEELAYRSYQSIVDKKHSCLKKLRKLFYKELCNA